MRSPLWLLLVLLWTSFPAGAKEEVIHEKQARYEITVKVPVMGTAAATALVRKLAQAQVALFKKDFKDMGSRESPPWNLEINYRIPYHSPSLVAVVFEGDADEWGAHGAPYAESVVMDPAQGKRLTLKQLLVGDYLKAMADYCRPVLKEKDISEADWIERGAGPKAENYEVWFPTPEGMGIIFQAYQVAPYVAGPQEVTIPWAALKTCIHGGPLEVFLKGK